MESSSCYDASWLLFGANNIDDDSCSPDFEARPIPRVHVIASAEYGTQVVELATTTKHNITTHAPSVQLSGCGASVQLLQPNGTRRVKGEKVIGTGSVVWGCAPALCTVLSGNASCFSRDDSNAFDFSNVVVLELGAGTGALGLWIAAKWPTATVILTDLPEAMDSLRVNIAANQLTTQCAATEFSFGEDVASVNGGVVNVIVASDCQFSTNAEFLWEPFLATLASAAPHTQVFISLQERHGTCRERLEPF